MTTAPDHDDLTRLGGRLALLWPADLDSDQQQVYDALAAMVLPEAAEGGFTARLADGRFIGPFNALLRVPSIALSLGRWTGQIARSGLPDDVRQVVILTVGAAWAAEYEIDAHIAAARAVGLPDAAVAAIVQRRLPAGLGQAANVAHRLTAALLTEHDVPEELYRQAVGIFGEAGLVTVLCLIGQYQTISSLLTCFRVPAPDRAPVTDREAQ